MVLRTCHYHRAGVARGPIQAGARPRFPANRVNLARVSGAIGNLWDRVRWDRGVIDFIGPINLGFWDFPIFNVADMAITCGAVLLAISFWLEEHMELTLRLRRPRRPVCRLPSPSRKNRAPERRARLPSALRLIHVARTRNEE